MIDLTIRGADSRMLRLLADAIEKANDEATPKDSGLPRKAPGPTETKPAGPSETPEDKKPAEEADKGTKYFLNGKQVDGVEGVVAAAMDRVGEVAALHIPKFGAAPFTAGVETSQTAPVVQTATSVPPVPSPPVVVVPPVPPVNAATTSAPSAPPAPSANAELDGAGLPWDARIHASTKAKLADGKWRYKKQTPKETIAQVEGELRKLMTLPVVVAATTAPDADAFASFLARITAAIDEGVLTHEQVHAACSAAGLPTGLLGLQSRPDLIPQVEEPLTFAVIAARDASGN